MARAWRKERASPRAAARGARGNEPSNSPGRATSTTAMKYLRRLCANGGTGIQRGAMRPIFQQSAEDFLGTSHESGELRITDLFLAGLATLRET